MNVHRFLIHLRLHYQIGILSGGYLLGGVLAESLRWEEFWLQFLNVHILLFGGATAFNSWWDKDEGPIGGLRHPPAMEPWMRDLSLWMQVAGLAGAAASGLRFAAIYTVSLLLFWAYSSPLVRWKGRPLLSLWVIGISTGFNSLLLGGLAAGAEWELRLAVAAAGTGLIIVSLYPLSQIYQLESDRQRGDRTFALRFGIGGVRRLFYISFPAGVLLISLALGATARTIGLVFAATGVGIWIVLSLWIGRLRGEQEEYTAVMRIKYGTSAAFVSFLAVVLTGKATGWLP